MERKAGGDFVALSLLDGRIAEQAAKLRPTYDKVIWNIEGNPYDGHIALEPKVITGAISDLAVVEGATVLRTQSLQKRRISLLSMAKRLQDGRRDLALRPSKPPTRNWWQSTSSSDLLGSAARRPALCARALRLGAWRSCTAEVADIAAIRGFGQKTAEAIRTTLDTPYQDPL